MKNPITEPEKISEYFQLKVLSDELEFLDIYANEDIQLFIDPYGITSMGTKWSYECEKYIIGYFQYLVDCIRLKDRKMTEKLLHALHEVDEIGLGYSSNRPKGRGIGDVQAKEIQKAFENSQAVKSGDLKDIADCALMIPGINRDKISDITANILKKKLIEFTNQQCKQYNIQTRRVAVNNAFDYPTLSFNSYYALLPIANGKPKILLPINSVRREPNLSKDKYYRNFVIEFLKAEHEHAGDSLARVLKNGKVVVRIKDLKASYPLSSEFLYEFSKEHPIVLEKYKAELRRIGITEDKPTLDYKSNPLSAEERIEKLNSIKTGKDDALKYQEIIFNYLIYIFGNRLSNPKSEVNINNGRKRIDIVFNNNSKTGFFAELNELHHIQCPKILIECKNYGSEIGNPEVDQLEGRLNKRRGMFGILVCRKIKEKDLLLARCKDIVNEDKGYIIALDDTDIKKLLRSKDENESEIDDLLKIKLDELIM
jgi:hypothetical protein